MAYAQFGGGCFSNGGGADHGAGGSTHHKDKKQSFDDL